MLTSYIEENIITSIITVLLLSVALISYSSKHISLKGTKMIFEITIVFLLILILLEFAF